MNTKVEAGRQNGQALILAVLAMTVMFVIGVIVIDFTLWFTERRGAQKDADVTTMAGAMELLQQDFVNPANNNFAAIQASATDAVYQWADYNELPQADVHDLAVGDTDCLGFSPVVDTVELNAEHHTGPLFVSIFNILVPQIGAHAKACLGSITTAEGLLPVGIQIAGVQSDCWKDVDGDGIEDPLFGQECVLTFGAGEQASGEAGNLRLFNDGTFACSDQTSGGSKTYQQEIQQGGASTECHVYKYFSDPAKTCDDDPGGCVYPLTGVGSNPELKSFETLMSTEGKCDAKFGNGDGIDQFLEVVQAVNGDPTPSPDTIFSKRDCTSPRLVSLIIIKQFSAQGNPALPIEAFAGFFIKGCQVDTKAGTKFSEKCDSQALGGNIGQFKLKGYFVNLLVTAGTVGQISKWSPKQIVLVE